jgi:hypothetical protein
VPNPFIVEFLMESGNVAPKTIEPTLFLELTELGPTGASSNVVVVPTGTTGWASQPDGTLWIEYTP